MESIRVNGASVTINLVIEDKKLAEFFEEFDGADEKATKFLWYGSVGVECHSVLIR